MYIPVRSAGGAVDPLCVQKTRGETVVSHFENILCRLNQTHTHARSPFLISTLAGMGRLSAPARKNLRQQ